MSKKRKITILITGGAGFIGSNLVRACLRKGYLVRVIDNLSTGKKENLKDVINKIKFFKADINNQAGLKRAMQGVDYVFHEAAMASVIRSFKEPHLVNKANVEGTLNVLMAAKEAGVKRVVYAASSSAYGDSKVYPTKEIQKPMPISNYGVSKLTGEYYMSVFFKLYGLETICLRYFNVFGPFQDPHSEYAAVIPRFISAAIKNQPVTIYGDGKQTRDFTFIKNIIEANLKAITAPKNACGQTYNVALGKRVSLLDIVEGLEKYFDKKIKIDFKPPRPGDVKHSIADITLAKKNLKFRPVVNFDEGLKETIKWYIRNLKK